MLNKLYSGVEKLLMWLLVHIWVAQQKLDPDKLAQSMREENDHPDDTYLVTFSCNAEWLDLVSGSFEGIPGLDVEAVKNLGRGHGKEDPQPVS